MKKVLIGVAVIIILGVGYYLVSPVFRNVEINDELPQSKTNQTDKTSVGGVKHLSDEEKEEMAKMIESMNMNGVEVISDEMSEPVDFSGKAFDVKDTPAHPAEGAVKIIETEDGTIIRYENFETLNGPNLHIYLAKDLEAKEYVDLGPIRGTRGNINYTVPEGVDVAEYRYVMHWCVPFRVLFNYAEIQ